MYPEALVFGIVDRPSPQGDAALASKLRDLTISWSRYDYRGRILVGETIDGVLDQALELGYRWCLSKGLETSFWSAGTRTGGRKRFDQCVSHWIGERDFLALGACRRRRARASGRRTPLGRISDIPDIRRPLV